MNCFKSISLFLIILIAGDAIAVKVSVYYEALCPDSVRFICLQLYPTYRVLKKHIQLDLIPYGKATHNLVADKWNFQCQHGFEECKGNKYQSCALSSQQDEEKNLDYINCVMRTRNPANLGDMESCAKKIGINWADITHCASNEHGDNLLAQNGDKTNAVDPNISFIPTVILDDSYDSFLQEQSLNNFAAVVCSKIVDDKPEYCQGRNLPSRDFWDSFI